MMVVAMAVISDELAAALRADLLSELAEVKSKHPPSSIRGYLWGVFGLSFTGMAAVAATLFMRLPTADTLVAITSILGFCGTTVTPLLAAMIRTVQHDMNSRMDQLRIETARVAESKGAERGRLELKAENKEIRAEEREATAAAEKHDAVTASAAVVDAAKAVTEAVQEATKSAKP